ncbi:MAG: metallophosphoesterase family protein [Kiritimatiellae bacterium]|nr:metallophosphoesterase family protein [Kiritimatiellia bacterium]
MTTGKGSSLIGVIADTHGLLREWAVAVLKPCDLVIHAGDIGRAEVLADLRRLGRVVAVRGNVDRDPWARTLPKNEVVQVGAVHLYVLHDLSELDLDPKAAGIAAVLYGHSHAPAVEQKRGVLYVNPGSAGPRRFSDPVSLARLRVTGTAVRAEIVVMPEP